MKSDQIIENWVKLILVDSEFLGNARLKELSLPDELKNKLSGSLSNVLDSVVANVTQSKFVHSEPGSDDLLLSLKSLLEESVVLPAGEVRHIVKQFYQPLLDEWNMNPISFRNAKDDPQSLTDEIINRSKQLISQSENGQKHEIGVLSEICELSGLATMAMALQIEAKLGFSEINRDELLILTTRLLKLKDHYRVGRKLSFSEGVSSAIQTVSESVPAEVIPDTHVGGIVETEIQSQDTVQSPETVDLGSDETAETASAEEVEVLPDGIPDNLSGLYRALMEPSSIQNFSESLFDGSINDYKLMVMKICKQKKFSNALILTDNELFVRDKPPTIPPAMELVQKIKDNFVESDE